MHFLLWIVLVKEDYVKKREPFVFVPKGPLRPESVQMSFLGFIKLMYHVHI